MKKLTSLALSASLLLSALLIQSCDKVKDLIKINVPIEEEVSFDIPVQSGAVSATYGQKDIYLNIDSIIKKKDPGFGIGAIKSAKILSCRVGILNSDASNNFGVIQSMKAEFLSNVNSTWTTVAEITGNPDANTSSLTIPINESLDLVPYFKTTQFSYRFSGTTRRGTSKVLNCKAFVKYQITVGP